MPFIRLCDSYIDHPKFLALSASSFRLWHEGMAFCRKHQTDGVIPFAALQGFRYFKPIRATELATPYVPGKQPLWETVSDVGYVVHDYLDWNLSREEEQRRQKEGRERIKKWRQTPPKPVTPVVTYNVTHALVLDQDKDRIGSLRKETPPPKVLHAPPRQSIVPVDAAEDVITTRGAQLVERYQQLYKELRRGAHLRMRPNLDWVEACTLCRDWDDARLEKLARVILTTDEPWIAGTDRGFKIFATRASWADDRLKQAEGASA